MSQAGASRAGGPVAGREQHFRFFDNREKYLLFVTTCNEKQTVAERVTEYTRDLAPAHPALRVFDAGMGDATVLTRVMMHLHHRFPTVPFLVIAKEVSEEDVRLGLEKMADRFAEHPQTVLVLTNMFYGEAPWLLPASSRAAERLNWVEVRLRGESTYEFDKQIRDLEPLIREGWQTTSSELTGNPLYVRPSVLIIYREDQRWPLEPVVPVKGRRNQGQDLIIAAQPYRARQPAARKVRHVLAPLAAALAPNGRMVVCQATGKDPGMDIIRRIWSGEDPFQGNRNDLVRELRAQLGDPPELEYVSGSDQEAEFRYQMHYNPPERVSNIGTSTLLAAWNAATYVAQIEDERLRDALADGRYLEATWEVLRENGGLWFTDESFVVRRRGSAASGAPAA